MVAATYATLKRLSAVHTLGAMDRLGGMWCDTLSSLQYALASAVYWNVTARTHREKEGGRRGVETLWRDRREMETVKDLSLIHI